MNFNIKNWELLDKQQYFPYDLKITLKPCYKCNQKCWFCKEYDNNSKQWNYDDCLLVLDKLKTLPERFKKIFIYFYGGEPTLNPNLEFIIQELYKNLGNRIAKIQIQTNLSISIDRLKNFKQPNLEICSSYHIGKQDVSEFILKLRKLKELDILGYCFINTEYNKEKQFIQEFNLLAKEIPNHLKMRFTIDYTKNPVDYRDYFYFSKKYPYLMNYLEQEYKFKINSAIIGYDEAYNKKYHEQLYLTKCSCVAQNLVIDNNLNVYCCNDYAKPEYNINPINIKDLDFNLYFKDYVICRLKQCNDGLEFKKWR